MRLVIALLMVSVLFECAHAEQNKPSLSGGESGGLRIVAPSIQLVEKASAANGTVRRLLSEAEGTFGVPYKWGGTRLKESIDCSNYTWLLYRKAGFAYDRFLSTRVLSKLKQRNGLRKIDFKDAAPGDLLIYGYEDSSKKWHGHVVILIDKDGKSTGHKGLVLGAHGKPVEAVQFVVSDGFDHSYFKKPEMRLCNVLRADTLSKTLDSSQQSPAADNLKAAPEE